MKCFLICLILIGYLIVPVHAMDFTAPQPPASVVADIPTQITSFGEDLWKIIYTALSELQPEITDAMKICARILIVLILIGIVENLPEQKSAVVQLVGVVTIGIIIMGSVNTMLTLGVSTINDLTQYGKLLLPVLTAALSAQGGITSSSSLYTGTVVFTTILTSVCTKLLVPLIYLYVCAGIANRAVSEKSLEKIQQTIQAIIIKGLKLILYVFTGYMSLTKVISGSVDASALKATKMTIAGMVPVVGGIVSDASETILVGAGIMKNSAGIYGLLVLVAIIIGPFLKIGIQYIILKLTSIIASMLSSENAASLVNDFSTAMGFILAMTGTVCLLLMIGIICFMEVSA